MRLNKYAARFLPHNTFTPLATAEKTREKTHTTSILQGAGKDSRRVAVAIAANCVWHVTGENVVVYGEKSRTNVARVSPKIAKQFEKMSRKFKSSTAAHFKCKKGRRTTTRHAPPPLTICLQHENELKSMGQ